MDPHQFHGKDIPHIKLDPKMTIEDLVDVFASSGFNGALPTVSSWLRWPTQFG